MLHSAVAVYRGCMLSGDAAHMSRANVKLQLQHDVAAAPVPKLAYAHEVDACCCCSSHSSRLAYVSEQSSSFRLLPGLVTSAGDTAVLVLHVGRVGWLPRVAHALLHALTTASSLRAVWSMWLHGCAAAAAASPVLSSTIARSHAESPHLRQFMYCYIDFAGTPMQQAPAASTATGSQSQGPVVAPTLHKIINYSE